MSKWRVTKEWRFSIDFLSYVLFLSVSTRRNGRMFSKPAMVVTPRLERVDNIEEAMEDPGLAGEVKSLEERLKEEIMEDIKWVESSSKV